MDSLNLYNDNELIYLIRNGDEDALNIMITKYEPLIKSKIRKFNFDVSFYDDYLQEGRLVLVKAIERYNTESPKTFNRYFDLILQNRFISLYRAHKHDAEVIMYDMLDVLDYQDPVDSETLEKIEAAPLSDIEKKIIDMRVVKEMSVKAISETMKMSQKQVYNALSRARQKIKVIK